MTPRRSLSSCIFRILPVLAALTFSARANPPNAPANFALTWGPTGTINCSWQDKSSNEVGFVVAYRATGSVDGFSSYANLAANITTYTDTPNDWPACASFDWAVFSYKGTPVEYSTPSNIVTVLAPPRLPGTNYVTGLTGQVFSHQLTTPCPNPVWTASPLPADITFNASTGVISGSPASPSRTTVNVTMTSGGVTVNQALKIHIFRPVPALVAPVNGTPLPNRTLRRTVAPLQIALGDYFSDPDVTAASRIVFNVGTIDLVYFSSAAPATVANFQGYISRNDYLNTIIHRCPKQNNQKFILQGGGYLAAPGTPTIQRQNIVVPNEPEISNTRGTVAMAKLGNNPNSATSEYLINLADNASNLNNQNEGFTVFARVAGNGMTVADSVWDLPNRNYSTVNSVLTDCPVTNPPPASFTPDSLVKILTAGPVSPLSYTVQSLPAGICDAAVSGGQLTLTPLANGPATITVTATDLDNQSISGTFNVAVEEHLADWTALQNFPVPADGAPTADPDSDSALNLMEYSLLTNPQSNATVPMPVSGTAPGPGGTFLTITFPVRKFAGPGLSYIVEALGDSGEWSAIWTLSQGFGHAQIVSAVDAPDRTTVTVRDTTPIAPGGHRFMRLKAVYTP